MRKCAKCNDFLNDHTCLTCHLRHQCLEENCPCHQYPNLPFCIGHNYEQWNSHNLYKKIDYTVNRHQNTFTSKGYKARNRMNKKSKYKTELYSLYAFKKKEQIIKNKS